MFNFADEIKSLVTMRQVCEMYGIEVNSQGFALCPFHNENTPSLKVYSGNRGFHCYGCGQNGSVIDFVMQLFNLDFLAAQKKLNCDFGLNLPIGIKPTLQEYRTAQRAAQERKRQLQNKQAERDRLSRGRDAALYEYIRLDMQKREFAPHGLDDELHPLFIEALQKLGDAEYQLDIAETRLYHEQTRC